jgi:hypothetical protein
MVLNWTEGSILLIEFAPKTFVKAMLRGSVIPKRVNLATLSMDLLGAYVGILVYTMLTRLTSFSGVSSKTFTSFLLLGCSHGKN